MMGIGASSGSEVNVTTSPPTDADAHPRRGDGLAPAPKMTQQHVEGFFGEPLSLEDNERTRASNAAMAKVLDTLPDAITQVEKEDQLDALIDSVERALRDETYPAKSREIYGAMWSGIERADAEDCYRMLRVLEKAKERAAK